MQCETCEGYGWIYGEGSKSGCCGGSNWECGAEGCTGPVQVQIQTQEECPDCTHGIANKHPTREVVNEKPS